MNKRYEYRGRLVEEARRLGWIRVNEPDKFEYTIKFPYRNFELIHQVSVVYPEEIISYLEQLESLFGGQAPAVATPAPVSQPAPVAAQPQQTVIVQGGAPTCPVHQVPMAPSSYAGTDWFCKKKDQTSSTGWCMQNVPTPA
jgi:hypothetical protein